MGVNIRARVRFNRLPEMTVSQRVAAEAATDETAEEILSDIQESLTGPKSGVQYPDLPNRSSAPGEAPATQSGQLEASYTAQREGHTVVISTDDPKAPILEFGAGDIAPRPHVNPAVERQRPLHEDRVAKAIGRVR